MSLIQIDIDEKLLEEAMKLMETTSESEAVNAALEDYLEQEKRRLSRE